MDLQQLSDHPLNLKDKNYDTGNLTANCEYSLANQTYTIWVLQLKENNFKNVDSKVRQNILNFFDLPLKAKNFEQQKNDCEKFNEAYRQLFFINMQGK